MPWVSPDVLWVVRIVLVSAQPSREVYAALPIRGPGPAAPGDGTAARRAADSEGGRPPVREPRGERGGGAGIGAAFALAVYSRGLTCWHSPIAFLDA